MESLPEQVTTSRARKRPALNPKGNDMTREELLDVRKRNERARRYLRSKEEPPTRGNIRAGLAFAALTIITLVIVLAL